MIETAPKILPCHGSAERPSWLVRFVDSAASSALASSRSTSWPELLIGVCEEVLALLAQTSRNRSSICDPAVVKHLAKLRRQSPSTELKIALAGELLGTMVANVSPYYEGEELCRRAYPRLWDLALDECANDPDMPEGPDQILYDHSIRLADACEDGPPWPSGLHYARHAVMEFAHHASEYSSHGLGLAHAAPVPVVWPPPEAPPALASARRSLSEALETATVSQDEYTANLHAYLAVRDNPNLPDPTLAETDQVRAALRDWNETVIPGARALAVATYAHAWEWASTDQDCWDLGVVVYTHTEAFLSVYHLRQATDAYDLTDAALRSYAWWWCHDRELDVASLREIAGSW